MEEDIKSTQQEEATAEVQENTSVLAEKYSNPWLWVRFGFVAFTMMLIYIYNQHHANKALRKKDKLIKELKEMHSEKISLESEVTNASKQTEIAKKLQETGIKELTKPPIKIEYRKEKK